jgi:hypothetical protein
MLIACTVADPKVKISSAKKSYYFPEPASVVIAVPGISEAPRYISSSRGCAHI